jgi:hypothetical protein
MTTAAIPGKAILATPTSAEAPPTLAMMAVARKYGLSPAAQLREAVSLRFGPGRIALAEYYSGGLFDPAIALTEKRRFVGRVSSREINDRLSPPGLTASRGFLRDRVMYTSLLDRLGLATTRTQAVAVRGRSFGTTIPTLTTPADLGNFLRRRAAFPVFGKPSAGGGSVLIDGVDGDRVVMSNGRRASLDGFCQAVFADFPAGFILQSALDQHPDLTRAIGAAVGALRVVTIRDSDAARVLYMLWKIPAPQSVDDGFRDGAMLAAVAEDGLVGRCRRGAGLDGHWIAAHPATGAGFEGQRIPFHDDLRRLACQAHALFPEFGIVGWDVAITAQGPVIVRADDDPCHVLWQRANGRGFRNPGFVAGLDAAARRSREIGAGAPRRNAGWFRR